MKLNFIEYVAMNTKLRAYYQRKVEARILRELSDLPIAKKILEIGCGNGYGTFLIQKLFKPAEINAVDIDPRMIKRARKNAQKRNLLNVTYQEASVTELPFESEMFDAILNFAIIHHIPNWEDAIKECARVLKKGGQFISEDLSLETWKAFYGKICKHLLDHPYASLYTVDEFADSLKRNGFNVIRLKKKYVKTFPFFFVVAIKN